MFRVAILGCENSHADSFLRAVINDGLVSDVEFVGVYSDEVAAAERLHVQFGVPVADSYDAFVGKVDGIIITARHGDNHYKYAKPYLDSNIPIFIDKPITCTESDAREFMQELKSRNVPVCGGSVCVLTDLVRELKQAVATEAYGKVFGGYLRAPVMMDSPYGGFFFYCQHLVQVMTDIFGSYPLSVQAFPNGKIINCVVRYETFDVNITFTGGNSLYYASISCEKDVVGGTYGFDGCFEREFMEFYDLLTGKPQKQTYEDFFAPVFVFNALARSLASGKEEQVNRI